MPAHLLDRPGTSDDARALRAELVGRASEIVPVLARNAARTEEDRRVVEENISLIDDAGLFSIMRPRRLGGLETDFRTKLEVSREIARGCGSTSWATTLMNVCAFFGGLYPDRAQRDVWADAPGNRIAGVLAPSAEAAKVDGGFRITGSWGWASGCLHAQWAVVGLPVPDEHGEIVDQGLALVPMGDLSIEDTWFVAGMRGTGSNTLHARDVFVPDHRVISIPAAIQGRYATEHADEVLYRSAFVPVAALVLAGPQLGLAQAALDMVIEKAPKRSVSYTFYDTQTDAPTFQLAVAKAASLVDAAHLFAYRAAADIDQAAVDGVYPDYAARARVRMDTGAAIENAREAIRTLVSAHGAGSFAEVSPLQRIWRDSEVASRHAVISPAISSEVYGRALLGLTDGVTALV
ncbi:acyl-CoA dehydrogenase family protein [Pseudonocardia endophytica]|uniref:Alkylation response protein AidB-like acyl-CoA dehydrogenase n=1 Tax=Pseudonocardia endophytica TaxID=401976 RepID=A0A4V2PHN9_PSEEN|nr:acyl-CoA dehydrogenase family protein [Pseudonocardia endophytica]TCK21466.1 alkylation response protein AidB-like acyl-CoA dehydrogenase [Pseudonocardia endophytica]